jgi:uncharacterized protein YjbJ (UPF0337 family)
MALEQKAKGDWNQVVGSVKEKYGQITDDELSQAEGSFQKLVGLIQRKSGKGIEQVEAFVHDVFEKAGLACGDLAQGTSECVQSTGQAIQQGYQYVADHARSGYEQTTRVIANRPTESVVAALAVGLITGIAIGISLSESRRPEPTWKNGWGWRS